MLLVILATVIPLLLHFAVRHTFDREIQGSSPGRALLRYVTTLAKSFTPFCLCRRAVRFTLSPILPIGIPLEYEWSWLVYRSGVGMGTATREWGGNQPVVTVAVTADM